MGKERSARVSLAVLGTAGALTQGVGFLYRVLLARLVPAEQLGLYHLVMPVFSILSAAALSGLTVCALRLTARYRALDSTAAIHQLMGLLPRLFLLLFGAVCCLLIPGAEAVATLVLGDEAAAGGILLLLPLLLFTGLENIHKNYFHGWSRVGPPAASELLEQCNRLALVCGLLLYFRPTGPQGVLGCILGGMVACQGVSALLMTVWARRRMRRTPVTGAAPDRAVLLGAIRELALPAAATALLGAATGSLGSLLLPRRLMAGGLTRPQALTDYGVLFSMAAPLALLPGALLGPVQTVLAPRLCGDAALGRTDRAASRLGRAFEAVNWAILPCAAALGLLGKPLLGLVFKNTAGAVYMPALAVLLVLGAWQGLLRCGLVSLGGQRQAALADLLGGGCHLGLSLWLAGIPAVGLRGYLWADGAVTAVTLLCFWRQLRARCGLKLRPAALLEPAAAAVTALLWGRLAHRLLGRAGPVLSLLLMAGIGLVLFGALKGAERK